MHTDVLAGVTPFAHQIPSQPIGRRWFGWIRWTVEWKFVVAKAGLGWEENGLGWVEKGNQRAVLGHPSRFLWAKKGGCCRMRSVYGEGKEGERERDRLAGSVGVHIIVVALCSRTSCRPIELPGYRSRMYSCDSMRCEQRWIERFASRTKKVNRVRLKAGIG